MEIFCTITLTHFSQNLVSCLQTLFSTEKLSADWHGNTNGNPQILLQDSSTHLHIMTFWPEAELFSLKIPKVGRSTMISLCVWEWEYRPHTWDNYNYCVKFKLGTQSLLTDFCLNHNLPPLWIILQHSEKAAFMLFLVWGCTKIIGNEMLPLFML